MDSTLSEILFKLEELKDILYMARKFQKMSLRELGKKTGFSCVMIYYFEKGLRFPTRYGVRKLALGLNLDVKKVEIAWCYGKFCQLMEKAEKFSETLSSQERDAFWKKIRITLETWAKEIKKTN